MDSHGGRCLQVSACAPDQCTLSTSAITRTHASSVQSSTNSAQRPVEAGATINRPTSSPEETARRLRPIVRTNNVDRTPLDSTGSPFFLAATACWLRCSIAKRKVAPTKVAQPTPQRPRSESPDGHRSCGVLGEFSPGFASPLCAGRRRLSVAVVLVPNEDPGRSRSPLTLE